jgi:hypothetical protein
MGSRVHTAPSDWVNPGAGRVLGGLLPEVLAAARPELVIYDAGTSSKAVQG